MTTIEVQTPLHGAAYQVLYERVNPVNCFTRARQSEIIADFETVAIWAINQPKPVQDAYLWARALILQQIDGRLKQMELQNECAEVLKTIERPPSRNSVKLPDMAPETGLDIINDTTKPIEVFCP